MPRHATGSVVERTTARRGRSFALRFRALGSRQYLHLGYADEGWTSKRADAELRLVLAQVETGTWRPPPPKGAEAPPEPTFHEFASDWLNGRRGTLRPTTILDYEWQLTNHLLPFFRAHLLSAITVREVDRYRDHKVAEGGLSAESINKTLTRLGQILELAVEYDLIPRNPMRVGRANRMVPTERKRPVYLDSAEQIRALLDAASDLDGRTTARTGGRRPLIATLVFAGLRSGEASALRWSDVDLANGRLTVQESKTDAGKRDVDISPGLHDELAAYKAARNPAPAALVFTTATGAPRDRHNINRRVLGPVVRRANELLTEREAPLLPEGLTPHKLRHTFASALTALGRDSAVAKAQLGHATSGFTQDVYTHVMSRKAGEREALAALWEGAAPA